MMMLRATIPLSLTILVSPEVEVLLGNGMGMVGWFFPLSLVFVAALHLLTLHAYDDIYGGRYGPGNEHVFLTTTFGHWLPLVTSLSSRAVFMVCGATISLVTAGFVFNEVFVHWFPNFAFAFLLLALVVALQLAGRRWALRIQCFLVFFIMILVAIMAAAGFSEFSGSSPVGEMPFQGRGLLLPLVMVVGVEFAYVGYDGMKDGLPRVAPIAKILMGVVFFFILWGIVMPLFVDPARLAQSFNPQMIVARQVLGQPGRLIMGAALIAGAAALVNGLLLVLHSQLAELLPVSWTAGHPGQKKWLSALGVVALATAPAVMMATGMAGEEMIDVYARVALVFWLLHYSLIHFAVVRRGARRQWHHLLAGLFLAGAGVVLGWTDPEPFVFLKSVVMMVLCVGAISLFIMRVTKKLMQGGLL